MTLRSFLNGSFLASAKLAQNWPFILYISFLALLMIASSHSAERKVYTIARLTREMKELSSQYLEQKSQLMQAGLESRVIKRAKAKGLEKPNTPPHLIIVKEEDLHESP